jgi:hypothetical protein
LLKKNERKYFVFVETKHCAKCFNHSDRAVNEQVVAAAAEKKN